MGVVWWWLEQDKEIIFREGYRQDLYVYSIAKQINKGERVTKTAYTFFKCDSTYNKLIINLPTCWSMMAGLEGVETKQDL